MNVKELKEALEQYPDDHVVMIDPPYSELRSVYDGYDDGVVELKH